jgi:propanol-preferring alcohol dehydrogenase
VLSSCCFPFTTVDFGKILTEVGLTIRGSSTGSAKQMDELLQLAVEGKITPKVEVYDFADAPKILQELQRYEVTGRKVVRAP